FSSRRRHTRSKRDWSSDVCSSDLCNSFIAKSSKKASQPRAIRLSIGWILIWEPSILELVSSKPLCGSRSTITLCSLATWVFEARSEERRVGKSVGLGGRTAEKEKM